jgi:hypothetical protein
MYGWSEADRSAACGVRGVEEALHGENGMNVIDDLLETTCKKMIKTILFCLDNATKGTIYRIGPMPGLRSVRVTSGIRREGNDEIRWGLPSVSDYNFPGKTWEEYRDSPGRPLEAMGWCVEKQLNWTADNPYEDVRSVAKQLRGEIEDSYHMEPVLVRKSDLYGNCSEVLQYPMDWRESPIWQDSEYVVSAVIKIHFMPNTLRREDRSTKIIKELSRSLGTELLSLHLRESLFKAQKEFDRHRLQSCKILAHDLRNTLIKFGFVFSAANAQIGILREEWEKQLREAFPDLEWKTTILTRLNGLIRSKLPLIEGNKESTQLFQSLTADLDELASLPLMPTQGEQWLLNKIMPKLDRLFRKWTFEEAEREEITDLLHRLERSLWLATDETLARRMTALPPDLREKWPQLAYTYFTADKLPILSEILDLLEHPALPVEHKYQIAKVIKCLKALIEVVPEIEERANKIIFSIRNGSCIEDREMGWCDPQCPTGTAPEDPIHAKEPSPMPDRMDDPAVGSFQDLRTATQARD